MLLYEFILMAITLNIFKLVVSQDCRISKNNELGKCVSIHSCTKVQNDLQNSNIQPDICSFKELEPIVCCPLNSSQNRPTSKPKPSAKPTKMKDNLKKDRISVQRCKELYDITHPKQTLSNGETIFFPSIVGGKLTEIGEFPFMAAIGWKRYDNKIEFKCGGFLVEKNFVITAAHCISLGGAAPVVVRTGGNRLDDGNSIDIPIKKIYKHPKYRNEQTYNDIAIIKLKNNSTHVTACLWQTKDIKAYKNGTAIGYGHIQFAGKGSNDLLKVQLKFYKNNECTQYYKPQSDYPSGLKNSQLCAGDPDGAMDTCQGDSGGPILIKTKSNWPYVIGLTSFGSGCAGNIPSIYTRISSYLDWIESIVWK